MKDKKKNKQDKPPDVPPEQTPPASRGTWQFLQDISASRGILLFCALLLPFAAMINFTTSQAMLDQDIWFHLAYGREYVQNMSWLLDHSQFSWTPARSEWMYVTWLGASAMYLIHGLAGVHGLFAAHWLIIMASAGSMVWLARSAGVHATLGLLTGLLIALSAVSFSGNYIKPEMFSILLITLTAVSYFRFKIKPGPWIVAVLPLIFLVWVNTHGIWIFGLAFIGLVLFMDWVERVLCPGQGLDKKALLMLSAATGITLVVLAVNPYGITYPLQSIATRFSWLFSLLGIAAEGAGAPARSGAMAQIIEYGSMWPHLWFGEKQVFWTTTAWTAITMFLAHTAVWAISLKRTGRVELAAISANVVFFLMGMYIGRLTLVYALIWLPSLIYLARRIDAKHHFSWAGPLLLAGFLLFSGANAAKVAFIHEERTWLGMGYRNFIPDEEVAFIMDNNLPGPLFNDYISGAYLMWAMYPEYKVFIDPRHSPYRERVFPDYQEIGGQFPSTPRGVAKFMHRYPARIALIEHRAPHLMRWLPQSPDWSLAYFGANASVLLRRDVGTRLGPEARAMSLSPERFRELSNPLLLQALFNHYNRYGSHLGAMIRDYYEQNVSSLYYLKDNTLARMDNALAARRQREGR